MGNETTPASSSLSFCNAEFTSGMDLALVRASDNLKSIGFKVSKNTKKCSKVHYICRPCSKQSTAGNKVEDERQLTVLLEEVGLTPAKISPERGCYSVQLDTKQAIPWFIHQFQSNYRAKEEVENTDICIINTASLSYPGGSKTDTLRQLVIADHLNNLLDSSGSPCRLSCGGESIRDLIQKCISSQLSISSTDSEKLLAALCSSSHVASLGEGKWDVTFPKILAIQGNSISSWTLVEDSGIFRELCALHNSITNQQTVIYHIINSSDSYQHQIMLAILSLLLTGQLMVVEHCTVEVGSVKLSPPGDIDSLVKSRREYLKTSSEEKYGSVIHEEGFWSKRLSDLTLASLKFELLARSPKQIASVTTDLDGGSDIKVGSFVLYNCSRLSTLFNNYELKVKDGVYPALYRLEDVDFSLLKTEDEWVLVFYYLSVYPVLVCELRKGVRERTTSLCSQLSQMVKFLHNLSRDLSTYYSRTHILGESRPHLMPTMMARLWLLRLIHRVLVDGLHLVSIESFESM